MSFRIVASASAEFQSKYREYPSGVHLDGADPGAPIGLDVDEEVTWFTLEDARAICRDIELAIKAFEAMAPNPRK